VFLREGCDRKTAIEVADTIKGVPGVARVSCGFKCERNLVEMGQVAIEALSECEEFETFKVHARRNHTDFETDSMQMNQIIGADLCRAFPEKGVKMKDPDITVVVEVVQNASYIYARSVRGVGGLPVGSSGKVVSLLSSGIDSPVALWKMARRGATCIGVHFSGRPQTSDASEYLVDDIARVLERTGCIARTYVVPFGDYQKEIALACPPSLRVILYRRLMFKVAEAIAHREHAGALVTGESLGQVASQTAQALTVTDAISSLPVFRPCIGMDKEEIITISRKIDTFETSIEPYEDCCTVFTPKHPKTKPELEKVLREEAKVDVEALVAEALETLTVTKLSI
jgi:thiamine biosynthesis protein ThiI